MLTPATIPNARLELVTSAWLPRSTYDATSETDRYSDCLYSDIKPGIHFIKGPLV